MILLPHYLPRTLHLWVARVQHVRPVWRHPDSPGNWCHKPKGLPGKKATIFCSYRWQRWEHLVLSKQSYNLYCVIAGNLQEFLGLQLLHLQPFGPTVRALRDLPDDLGGVLLRGMRLQPAGLRSGDWINVEQRSLLSELNNYMRNAHCCRVYFWPELVLVNLLIQNLDWF